MKGRIVMKYIVGKPKIKIALFYSLFIMWWAIGALYLHSPWMEVRIFGLLLCVITLIIVLPGLSYCQLMWEVDSQMLRYTYYDNIIVKTYSFYRHIFKTKQVAFQVNIRLSQIDYIAVTYAKVPRLPFGAYAYDILFDVHLYDGSIVTFESLVTRKRKEFNQAVEFMKSQNIEFKDRYQILPELYKNVPISYYLENIEKGVHHD